MCLLGKDMESLYYLYKDDTTHFDNENWAIYYIIHVICMPLRPEGVSDTTHFDSEN